MVRTRAPRNIERHRARLMRPSFAPVGYSITLSATFSIDEAGGRADDSLVEFMCGRTRLDEERGQRLKVFVG